MVRAAIKRRSVLGQNVLHTFGGVESSAGYFAPIVLSVFRQVIPGTYFCRTNRGRSVRSPGRCLYLHLGRHVPDPR